MTRALVWKELREQGTVLVALVVLGCALLVAVAVLLETSEPGRGLDLRSLGSIGRLALVLLLMTAGLVAGGTLFAGEAEAGTLPFLQWLSPSRFAVWWRKVLAGAVMAVVCGGGLFTIAAAMGLVAPADRIGGWVLLAVMITFGSFGWGVLGSVLVRSSLAACGAGLGLGFLTAGLLYPATAIVLAMVRRRFAWDDGVFDQPRQWETALLTTSYALCMLPIPIAGWLYTAPDRSRRLAAIGVRLRGAGSVLRGADARLPAGRGVGVRRLVWLARRQLGTTALWIGGAALAAGFILVPPDSVPVAVWPAVSLAAGVICGVVGLADEQTAAAFRFWGERRMPAGRLWWAKVAAGLALTLLAVVLLLLPAVVAAVIRDSSGASLVAAAFRGGLLVEPEFPVVTYLLVWPLYGFACGHLAGLLFRKAIVAGAVGLLTGGVLAGAWLPSLLGGGLHLWQPFLPFVLVLVTARVLVWAWITDRLGTRRPLGRLAFGLTAAAAVLGLGLGYRVTEAPLTDAVEADVAFAKTLPTFDDKQHGRDLRRAVGSFSEISRVTKDERPEVPLFVGQRADANLFDRSGRSAPYLDRVRGALEFGWPENRPDLDRWMDRMFENEWDRAILESSQKPTGVLEDPNELNWNTRLRNLDGLRELAPLFLARGLQEQARGNPGRFADVLVAWLAAVRTTRNNTIAVAWLSGRGFEQMAYDALDRWLEKLGDDREAIRLAFLAVRRHESLWSFDPATIRLAHQTVTRNGVNAPSLWLSRYFEDLRPLERGRSRREVGEDPLITLETDLVGFAWTVPWEKERLRRTVGLGNTPGREPEMYELLRGAPGSQVLISPQMMRGQQLAETEKHLIATRRGALLKLALRLYELEKGRPAVSLEELVPAYLPKVPLDPFDEKPFRYRLSAGETIDVPARYGTRPEASPPPGLAPEVPIEVFHAVAGLAGGGSCWALVPGWIVPPPPPPPGYQPRMLHWDEMARIGSVVGGGLYWPNEPIWNDEPYIGSGPGFGMPGLPPSVSGWPPWPWAWTYPTENARIKLEVPAGQGIVWSVGPDVYDDSGSIGYGPQFDLDRPTGDLIFIVPRPRK